MRLLLDENLPAALAGLLAERAGWDVTHVGQIGMKSASDTDFGTLLASSGASGPSVVLLRIGSGRRAEQLAGLLMANLPPLTNDLVGGAMVVITDQRVRVRRLPIG